MRTREERVTKISEKMKSKNKLQDGYHGEKAQDFKNKYTEDVKTAAKGRRLSLIHISEPTRPY